MIDNIEVRTFLIRYDEIKEFGKDKKRDWQKWKKFKSLQRHKKTSKTLQQFLNQQDFEPEEVKYYGEISGFFKYFSKFDTTVYIRVGTEFNEHYSDDNFGVISTVSFSKKQQTCLKNKK